MDHNKVVETYSKVCDTPPHFSSNLDKKESTETWAGEHYTLPHPIWSQEESESVQINHRKPEGISDKMVKTINYCIGCFRDIGAFPIIVSIIYMALLYFFSK